MSAPGHAGDGDGAQVYLLTTGAGGVSHHALREALKNKSYCVRAYKLACRRVPFTLIHQLKQNIKQVWYADDATATGRVCDLKQWWDQLENIGPNYGYVVNPTKTWLIVKETFLSEANEIFKNTNICITTEGKYLHHYGR